mmetsp:Transcript_7293/g.11848  ORF Transcript_7293/g.11848 Transcript_7293/m.11848 type:complete len:93 (-) Transcript_7293:655-933(-)
MCMRRERERLSPICTHTHDVSLFCFSELEATIIENQIGEYILTIGFRCHDVETCASFPRLCFSLLVGYGSSLDMVWCIWFPRTWLVQIGIIR